MKLPFLLEIGTEEIPDWMIAPAVTRLRQLFEEAMAENGLGGAVVWAEATPRRLALYVEGIEERQADREDGQAAAGADQRPERTCHAR